LLLLEVRKFPKTHSVYPCRKTIKSEISTKSIQNFLSYAANEVHPLQSREHHLKLLMCLYFYQNTSTYKHNGHKVTLT